MNEQTPCREILSVVTNSEADTQAVAAQLAGRLETGDVIALLGILGAGKTCFVKGLARGLGLTDTTIVRSPTFILASEYPTFPPLYHLDAYRLSGAAELEDIGFDDYIAGDGICVVEWADRVDKCLPPSHLVVIITIVSETRRRVSLSWSGPICERRIKRLADLAEDPQTEF